MPLIDSVALKTDVRRYVLEGADEFGTISVEIAERSFLRLIDRQPTIEAEPVRHGRWIKVGESCGADILECPECHTTHPQCGDAFCRDCGAKMDGGAADDAES